MYPEGKMLLSLDRLSSFELLRARLHSSVFSALLGLQVLMPLIVSYIGEAALTDLVVSLILASAFVRIGPPPPVQYLQHAKRRVPAAPGKSRPSGCELLA